MESVELMPVTLAGIVGLVAAAAYPLAAFWAGGHALLHARDPRAAWGWIAVCLLFPLAGALLYYLFGINRVRRRARALLDLPEDAYGPHGRMQLDVPIPDSLEALRHTGDTLTGRRAVSGNRVLPLHNGEEAYPAMLDAIADAKKSVWLATYIFRHDRTGRQFMRALADAAQRGVQVRVLVDGVGALYGLSFPVFWLRRRGVTAARFLPPRIIPPMLHINLRNHRKVLVVDGERAFTGGMNIAEYHCLESRTRHPVADLHFHLRGPVVAQLAVAFADDWRMAAREKLEPPPPSPPEAGGTIARLITDGPDDDIDKLAFMLLAAVAVAHHRVRIMTPYFLPSPELTAALQSAALRGVEVTIILPAKSNLRFVDYATAHMLPALLDSGVRVFHQPPPFAHSKLFLVDDHYMQIGSANIDARSLRLNFELVVECYDPALAEHLNEDFEAVQRRATPVLATQLRTRRLPARLRNAFCWLFSSYL